MGLRLLSFAVAILLLALLSACAPRTGSPAGAPPAQAPAAAPPAAPTITKINYGEIGGTSDAGIYIANDKGYFREQGIELESARFQTAAEMVAPLATGQLDVGGGAPGAGLMNAFSRDIALKIVADKGNLNRGYGFQAVMTRKDLWDSGAVRGPADLRGRTIAMPARDITPEVTLDTYLRGGGLTVAEVNVATMPFPDMATALANRSIDAALPIEPFVTQIVEREIGVILTRNDDVTPEQQVAVILYSPKFAEEKPELARRFMVAYVKGLRDYNDAFGKKDEAKKTEVVAILVGNTAVKDPTLYDKMVMPGLNPNGRVNIESLEQSQTWWVAKGSQQAKVDLSKVVDHQFVDWAVQQLGPYR